MTPPVSAGLIGAGRLAAALAEHAAPLSRVRVLRCAPSPRGRDRAAAVRLAERLGAETVSAWQTVAGDPGLPLVLVLSEAPGRIAAAEAALAAGKVVLCPCPAAGTRVEARRLTAAAASGGGVLLAPGEIRHTPAGKRALSLATGGALGALHAVYAAIRHPAARRAAAAAPDGLLWDALDVLCAAAPGPWTRVYAQRAALFGAHEDTAVVVARLGATAATIEVSRCLPPALPAPPQGEVEIEMIGSRDAVRVEPYRTAVRLHGRGGAALLPWLDEPVLSMLDHAVRVSAGEADRTGDLAALDRAVTLMDAIRTSAATGEAVAAQEARA